MSTMLVWITVLSLLGQPVISLEKTTSKMEKNLMSLLKMQHRLSSANEEPTNQHPGTQVKHDLNPSVKISNIVQEIANTSKDHPRMSDSQESAVSAKLSHRVNGDGEKLVQNNHSRLSDKHSTKRFDYMDYLGDHTGKRNQHDSQDALPDSTITAQSSNKVRPVAQKIEPNGFTKNHRTKRSPLDYLDYLGLHAFKRGGQNNYDYLESDYFLDDGGTGKGDAQNYIDYIDRNSHTSKRNGRNKIVVTRDGKIDDHYMDYIDHDVHKRSEAHYLDYLPASKRGANNYMDYLDHGSVKRSENHYLDYLQASKRGANNYMDYLGSDKRSENNYLDSLHSSKRNVNKYSENLDTGKRNEHHYLDYLQVSKRDVNNYMDYLDRASSKRSENQYPDDLLDSTRDATKYMYFLDHDTKKRTEHHDIMDMISNLQGTTETTTTSQLPMDYINVESSASKRESHKNRDYIDSDQPYQRFMADLMDYINNLGY